MSEKNDERGNGSEDSDGPSSVNQQILDAVKESTKFAFGVPESGDGLLSAKTETTASRSGAGTPKYDAGMAIAYEKVAQATAYMVQDAADYQRNMMSINGTAQGKALAKMFEDVAEGDPNNKLGEHAAIFVLSILGSLAAGFTADMIGKNAGCILESYKNPTPEKTGRCSSDSFRH